MKILVTGSGGVPLVAEVHPTLEDRCRRILADLAKNAPSTPAPERVTFDGFILEMRRIGGEVLVCEPDYFGELTRYIASLNVTCAICDARERLHAAVSAPRMPVRYDEGVAVEQGLLDKNDILASRSHSTGPNDSGWRLIPRAAGEAAKQRQWEALRLYRLVARRAIVVVGIQLPVGWSFMVEASTITDVATPHGGSMRVGVEFLIPS